MNGIGVVRAGDAWKQTVRTVPKKLVPGGEGGTRTLGFFPSSIPASASEDAALFKVSRTSCFPFIWACWCFSMSSRSFSSFSLSCCCFSSLVLMVMSSSWAVCNDASSSPCKIYSWELSKVSNGPRFSTTYPEACELLKDFLVFIGKENLEWLPLLSVCFVSVGIG